MLIVNSEEKSKLEQGVELEEKESAAFNVSIDAVKDLTQWVENNFNA